MNWPVALLRLSGAFGMLAANGAFPLKIGAQFHFLWLGLSFAVETASPHTALRGSRWPGMSPAGRVSVNVPFQFLALPPSLCELTAEATMVFMIIRRCGHGFRWRVSEAASGWWGVPVPRGLAEACPNGTKRVDACIFQASSGLLLV